MGSRGRRPGGLRRLSLSGGLALLLAGCCVYGHAPPRGTATGSAHGDPVSTATPTTASPAAAAPPTSAAPPTTAVVGQAGEPGRGALSFVDRQVGFATDEDGGAIIGTVDGGRHWTVLAVPKSASPLADAGSFAFVTPLRGWAWSEATSPDSDRPQQGAPQPLMGTTDGGHTWAPVRGVDDVVEVLPLDGTVWVVTAPSPTVHPASPETLWVSTDDGGTWTRAPVPPPVTLTLRRITRTTAYGWDGRGTVLTTDSGTTWTTTPATAPCVGDPDIDDGPLVASGGIGDLWYLCLGEPGAGSQPEELYRSSDGGRHWTLRDSDWYVNTPTVGTLRAYGYPYDLTVVSPTTAYIGEGRGGLLETTDGGSGWTNPVQLDESVSYSMYSPTGGFAVAGYPGVAWATTDGTDWDPVAS